LTKTTIEELEAFYKRLVAIKGDTREETMRLICEDIKKTMGCDLPTMTHEHILAEGEEIEVHVDVGLCPAKKVSGKTDVGEVQGENTSVLGQFYDALEQSLFRGISFFLPSKFYVQC
jgi:hypothetical protein